MGKGKKYNDKWRLTALGLVTGIEALLKMHRRETKTIHDLYDEFASDMGREHGAQLDTMVVALEELEDKHQAELAAAKAWADAQLRSAAEAVEAARSEAPSPSPGRREVVRIGGDLYEVGPADGVLTMDDVQADIHDWAERTFRHNAVGIAAHLLAEATELYLAAGGDPNEAYEIVAVELRRDKYAMTSDEYARTEGVREETADVSILALTMAGFQGFSASQAVEGKMARNKARRWGEPNQHGFTEHVREETPNNGTQSPNGNPGPLEENPGVGTGG